ncbi:hypothetical protein Q9L58_002380 [Maublancomyces gigas]|uniref:F-box domain-containing protein n=1 Tax=Discina gigas TaxID=1032678 RepID=A0ABR3GRU0_9PEZI
MQVLPPPPASRGPDILTNPVILESILPELPHLSDILSLQLVSRQLYLLVQPLHPLYAREISLAHIPHVRNKDLVTVLHRSLRPGPSTQRRLLADGRTVTVGEGMGKAYVGPWRFLRVITLTGTSISSRSVKLLIAASSGGKIPGLPELLRERQPAMPGNLDPAIDALGITSGFFAKEFGAVSPGAYRLLADQSLRLDKLCVTDCPEVDISDINNFLKKILIVVTAPKRRELRLRASQLAAAQQQQNAPPAGPGAPPGFLAAQQQQMQPAQEDLTSIPYPLPATVDELADFGLPCLSLRRLEVANVKGLWVDPPERFRNKREWNYSKDCPYGRHIGSLNSIAGCLGLDVDVLFCQGAGCATSSDNGRWRQNNPHGFDVDDFDAFDGIIPDLANAREHNPQAPSQTGESTASAASNDRNNHRRTYHYPLPRLPGERILMTEDGRVFRIPRHAIPNQQNQAAQAQQQQHAINLFQAAMNAQLPAQAPVGAQGVAVAPPPGPAHAAGNAAAVALGVHQNVWNAWAAGLGGGNGGNGNLDANGGAANGWASNLFLQDPAQYGLGVWQQPQQQDNQTQTTAANGQTLMQTLMQNFPGTPGATTNPTPVTVTPQQPQQQDGGGPVPQASSVEEVVDTDIAAATNSSIADFSQGDSNTDQGNTTIVISDDIVPADAGSSTGISGNGEGPSTVPNSAIWQSHLTADGVQTPPYNQHLSPTIMSWNSAVGPPPSTAGPSSVAGPSSAALPPPPTQASVIDPPWASFLTTIPTIQTPLNPAATVAGHPNLFPLPAYPPLFPTANITGNHLPLGQNLTIPATATATVTATAQVQDPALATMAAVNVPTNANVNLAPFAHLLQTHPQNVSLPRRRNNSPGGSRGGTGQTGARPGRRIAMLDGPRGLCEGCGREVWLCDSCNRYWVVTCGGCAAKQ